MRRDWIISDFKENYNFQERFLEYSRIEKQKNKKYNLTKKGINDSFLMGDTTLVGNYGVVISLNWLIKVKKMPKREAVKLVVDACMSMYKRDMIEMVQKSTEIYSPYPSDLVFKSPQLIFDKIDKDIHLNVKFDSKNKIDFL